MSTISTQLDDRATELNARADDLLARAGYAYEQGRREQRRGQTDLAVEWAGRGDALWAQARSARSAARSAASLAHAVRVTNEEVAA